MFHYVGLNHENIDTLTMHQMARLSDLVREINDK